jgi:hypothetical protein
MLSVQEFCGADFRALDLMLHNNFPPRAALSITATARDLCCNNGSLLHDLA